MTYRYRSFGFGIGSSIGACLLVAALSTAPAQASQGYTSKQQSADAAMVQMLAGLKSTNAPFIQIDASGLVISKNLIIKDRYTGMASAVTIKRTRIGAIDQQHFWRGTDRIF